MPRIADKQKRRLQEDGQFTMHSSSGLMKNWRTVHLDFRIHNLRVLVLRQYLFRLTG